MQRTTRSEQIGHLLQLIEDCPGPCSVVFKNPALPSGVVIHIPADEPAAPAGGGPQPSPAATGAGPA
jgi:hypothetical protein